MGTSQEVTLQLDFEDLMTYSPVDSVQIKIYNSSNKILFSQVIRNGENVKIDIVDSQKIRIKGQKIGYSILDTLIQLDAFQRQIDRRKTIPIHLKLKYKGQSSGEVDISGIYSPPVVYSSEQLEVSDYAIIDNNTLVLLVYPKRLNAGSELIWYSHDSIINDRESPEIAKELITDYRNQVYLRCETNDYLLQNGKFLTLSKVSRDDLERSIQPVIDTLDNDELFFNTYYEYYPAFDFYKFNLKDTSNALFHHIEDTVMMEQYRAEYKWADPQVKLWAWRKEDETGIDRQIWIGANYFTSSVYYEPPYGALFIDEDNAYVFDFYKNLLYTYDAYSGEKLNSIDIDFFLNIRKTWWDPGWKKTMLQDPITKKMYTYYDNGGFVDIYEINPENGKRENKFTLFYRYPENIQIYDGQVYYLYRPFASIQKKYLYKEGFEDPKRNLKGQERFSKEK